MSKLAIYDGMLSAELIRSRHLVAAIIFVSKDMDFFPRGIRIRIGVTREYLVYVVHRFCQSPSLRRSHWISEVVA